MGCVIDGSGGKEEATMWQCLGHGCCIWEAHARGGVYGIFVIPVPDHSSKIWAFQN